MADEAIRPEAYEGSKVILWRGSIDALNRKKDADFLTTFIEERFRREHASGKAGSLVLNIDAPWGTGKTFLMERWADDLKDAGWKILTFNAWMHDYSRDPLLTFIAEIQRQVLHAAPSRSKARKGAVRLAKALTTQLAPAVAKSVVQASARALIGAPALETMREALEELDLEDAYSPKSLGEAAAKATTQAAIALMANEKAISQQLAEFRKALQSYAIAETGDRPRPLVLLIDELDRCRPNFAVDLLEVLKHIFSVPGVYSVVATDTAQLAASAKGAYGPDFQAGEYLKRFFDLEYTLVQSDRQPLAYHLLLAEGLVDDDVFITPRVIVADRRMPDTAVFSRYGPRGSQHDKSAARALIVAAVAGRLGLSNREMGRMVQLLRAAADSLPLAAGRVVPRPRLHFFYLACLAGVFFRDKAAVQSASSARALLSKSDEAADTRDLSTGFNAHRGLASLFDEYRRDFKNLNYEGDDFSQEVAQSFVQDRQSHSLIAKYPKLILRCGQFALH